jgi:hypothetical protein
MCGGSFIYNNMCKSLRYCRCGSKLQLLSTVIVPYRGPPWAVQVLPSVNLQLFYKTLWSALHSELALMAYEVEPSLPLPVASIAFAMRVLWHVNFCFQSSGMLFLLEQWYRISKRKRNYFDLADKSKIYFHKSLAIEATELGGEILWWITGL